MKTAPRNAGSPAPSGGPHFGVGRQAVADTIAHVGLDRELAEAVARHAGEFGMSRAAFIRQAVRERVDAIARADEWVRERDGRLPSGAEDGARVAQVPHRSQPRPRPPKPPLPPERERHIREMYALYQTGATLTQVGVAYGLSPERVRQLFARLDLPRRHPAAHRRRGNRHGGVGNVD